MKILDFETIKNLANSISATEYYEWVDTSLKNKDSFDMPVKTRINQDNGDYYAIMPCLFEKENMAMNKMIGRHNLKDNEKRSIMMSDLLLYEADTGVLKAVMDCEYITTLRTGAIAAHAVMLYSKQNFKTIGLIGLGNIMTACTDVLIPMLCDRNVVIKLHKYNKHEYRLMERYKNYSNITFVLCDSYEDTIRDSDVVISALTRATQDFAEDTCFAEGCTVVPIMTLGFQNCDLFFDKVFTDEIEQIRGFKYFDKFKSINNTTDVLLGNADGRTNDKERILVYNYGLALLDLFFAIQFYKNSKDNGIELDYKYCKEKFFM